MARHARQQRPHRGLVLFVPWLGLCFCWAPAFVGSHTKIARRILLSSQATADPAVLEAAKQVRDVQDSGPSGNVQWNLYVNTFADAKDDGSVDLFPGSHDVGFLEDFVGNFNDGFRLSSASAAVAEGAQFEESGLFKEALDAYLVKQDVTGITAMSEEVAGEFLKICGQLCLKDAMPGAPAQSQSLQKVSSSASEVAHAVNNVQNSGPSGAKQWAEYLKTYDEGSSLSSSPDQHGDGFLQDFLDNFNDGYRLSSASAAAAECAQLESSGTFAKAMEDFLRRKGNDADIPAVSDEVASEFFKQCGQLVSLDLDDEVITPETPKVSAPKSPPLPPLPPLPHTGSLSADMPPLPPVPKNSGSLSAEMSPLPKNGKQGRDAPKEKVVVPPERSGKQKVKAQAPEVSKPPPRQEPAQSQRPALAPKTALEPQAMDAKARLNEWIHSRLKRKPMLGEDMTFGFALQEAGGRPNYAAELSFLNKKLVPSGTATFSGTPQKTKRDAMDSAAHAALLALDVET